MLTKNILLLVATAIPMASALRSETNPNARGVYGWCDFTWANANKVQGVACGARDRAADGHPVFAEVSNYAPPCFYTSSSLWIFLAFTQSHTISLASPSSFAAPTHPRSRISRLTPSNPARALLRQRQRESDRPLRLPRRKRKRRVG